MAALRPLLRANRLFSSLDPEVLDAVADQMTPVALAGGEVLCHEGAPADALWVLLSGRLRVVRQDEAGGQTLLFNEIAPGEVIGELPMLLEQPLTSTVVAMRQAELACLSRSSLNRLLQRYPLALNRMSCSAVYQRFRAGPTRLEQHEARVFLVLPLHPGAPVAAVAEGLSGALGAHRISSLNALSTVETQRGRWILTGDEHDSTWVQRAFMEADQLVWVASAQHLPRISPLEILLQKEPGFAFMRRHLVLMHEAGELPAKARIQSWTANREVERVYLHRRDHAEDEQRLARFLTGKAVGVVLGGGGARGFAHVGILKALIEAGMPLDILGGNSMGALIGGQYAMGRSPDEILEATLAFTQGGERPVLPLVSLLSGQRMARDLYRMFGEVEIETLWRPFYAAACNLSQACMSIQDEGLLWRAVLASNSPAGLLPPVPRQGDLLVDGGILDNVPVSAMRTRLGAPLEKRRGNGTVIAVDVNVHENLGVGNEVDRLSPWSIWRQWWQSGSRSQPVPTLMRVLSRATHIGGLAQRQRAIALSDHYLEPPVSEFSMMAYRKAKQIADLGYAYAAEQIARW